MSIPKIIHYCWFGGNTLPQLATACIESWKQKLPDYEIKEWNETNFDVHCCKYVEEAYEAKKWAFVSDYARFYVLHEYGGLYFDTDIEVLCSFDNLLDDNAFFGFGRTSLTLPVFGATKGHKLLEMILQDYQRRVFRISENVYDTTTIERTAERVLVDNYGLVMDGNTQLLDEGIRVYDKSYFSSTDWQTGIITRNPNLYVIHYADGSWMTDEQKMAFRYIRTCIKFLGEKKGTFLGTALFLLKRDGMKGAWAHAKSYLRRKTGTRFMRICRKIHKNPCKIVCQNFAGKGYGDNPKYIVEELLSRDKKYDIVWLVKPRTHYHFPKGVRTVTVGTFRELYELATAKVWIDNNRKEFIIHKSEDQIYIQTWHGFLPLKKIEKDAEKALTPAYIECAKHDGEMTDLMLSGCGARTKLYRKSFWYTGDILECGTPRNDIFFKNADYKDKVYQQYGLVTKQKTILYAPTFRDNHSMAAYNIEFDYLCSLFEKRFGGEWVCLIKLHPAVSDKKDAIIYSDRVIDATDYEDLQEMLVSCDVLISDYSNCIFEYCLTRKPVFIYASDIEEYMNTRDFYYDIRNLYFPLATNMAEMADCIINFDEEKYEKDTRAFFDKIELYEKGHASSCVADYIDEKILG